MANSEGQTIEGVASQIAFPATVHGEIGEKSFTYSVCESVGELVTYLVEAGFRAGIDSLWAEPTDV